jgi:glutamyl-tRNA synthetase
MIRTRFAPSPTGDLHLGGVWVALASWTMAREGGGVLVLRIEDIDRPRVVEGSEANILEDLRWLGIFWDEGPDVGGPWAPYRQSERAPAYEAALTTLAAQGLTYPCDCSRAEIARSASAPHAGEEARYPGTCRDRDPHRPFRRDPAVRLRLDRAGVVSFTDGVAGPRAQDLEREVGDFVLRRGDGVFAYQLAVAVDDAAMQISDVVRGADLLDSTPRQIYLTRLLGVQTPRYWHLPLVLSADGERLAKRAPGSIVRELRDSGVTPETIRARLAAALHLADGPSRTWPTTPWRIPREWALA